MKKYKSLIILLAVLVVLVVAYVVTGQLKKKSAEKENEEKQIAVLDMSDITSIHKEIVQDCQRIQKTQGNSTFLGSFLFVKI
mgnify:CR=1 FL=1|jgi:ABC-type molybdate transport system substrate-binding protein